MGEFNVNKSDGSLEQTAGMPSEYPATQVMMPSGTNLANGVVMKKLWENLSPTSNMATGTAIDLSESEDNFDLRLVVCKMNANSSYIFSAIGRPKEIVVAGLVSGGTMVSRQINYTDGTHLTAGAGWSGSTQDASCAIPIEIWGIKIG